MSTYIRNQLFFFFVLTSGFVMEATGQTPAGSYLDSSRDVKVMLECECQRMDGQWVEARLDITHLRAANLNNIDGVLQNSQGSVRRQGHVPGGSYQKSCREIQIILYATCQKVNGEWQPSSLDITYHTYSDISNQDGLLEY